MTNKKRKKVFVGMSGGVDSSVSVALLKEAGYEVVGVFIRTWQPDFLECDIEGERLDAMRVATHLGIPFLTFDLEDVYKREVADYMISEYRAGRTPNPDVMCNKAVKFGAFMDRAISMGADFVATGHYTRNQNSELLKGADPAKDQGYFLWTLTPDKLSKILFPVGHLQKSEVRKLAEKFGLPVAKKRDSQGICFLGDIDLKNFLKHYIDEKPGKVLNEKGEEIGHHDGVMFFTLGERRGFTITKKTPHDKPYYIVGKDVEKNILYVSQAPLLDKEGVGGGNIQNHHSASRFALGIPPQKGGDKINLKNCNWITEPKEGKDYTCQIRYHGEFLACRVKPLGAGEDPERKRGAEVVFEKPILAAPGQSIVIYDGDVVLGGGVIV